MKKKLKIVHFVSSFTSGGAEMLVKDIAFHQSKEHIVEIWGMNPGPDKEFMDNFANELDEKGINYRVFGTKPHSMRIKRLFSLRKALKETKPDIINTHSEVTTLYMVLASIGISTIIAQTIHKLKFDYPFLQRFFVKPQIQTYVAISNNIQKIIQDTLNIGGKATPIIYNGISLEKFQIDNREIKNRVKNIIWIGRLVTQKDPVNLLNAYKLLVDRLKSESDEIPMLNIVGDGPMRGELEELVKNLSIGDYVTFWGVRNDIPQLLFDNDLLVMSSKTEGLSIALLEACASGIPVVATDVGGNHEIVEHNKSGLLIEKKNSQMLSDAIYSLLNSPEKRKSFSDYAISKSKNFTIESTVKNYTRLFHSFHQD